jgi:hypothetical protein
MHGMRRLPRPNVLKIVSAEPLPKFRCSGTGSAAAVATNAGALEAERLKIVEEIITALEELCPGLCFRSNAQSTLIQPLPNRHLN